MGEKDQSLFKQLSLGAAAGWSCGDWEGSGAAAAEQGSRCRVSLRRPLCRREGGTRSPAPGVRDSARRDQLFSSLYPIEDESR
ncbi:unnamed protein product [Caretta caretta]